MGEVRKHARTAKTRDHGHKAVQQRQCPEVEVPEVRRIRRDKQAAHKRGQGCNDEDGLAADKGSDR